MYAKWISESPRYNLLGTGYMYINDNQVHEGNIALQHVIQNNCRIKEG